MSGFLYILTRSSTVSLWVLIGGVGIDFDHIYDYFKHPERDPLYRLNVREFFSVVEENRLKRVYVLLHSWELAAFVLICGWLFNTAGRILVPLGFGMAVHFLLDSFTNPATILSYSIIARSSHRFSGDFFYSQRDRR